MAKRLSLLILITLSSAILWHLYTYKNNKLEEKTLWYQMIWQGENVGFMREEYRFEQQQYAIRSETSVKTISQGQPYGFRETKVLTFDAEYPHKLLTTYYRYEAPGQLIETKLTNNGTSLLGTRQQNSELININLPFPELQYSSFRQINNWVAENPKVGETVTFLIPEISRAEVIETTYQVDSVNNQYVDLSYLRHGQNNERQLLVNRSGDVAAYRFGNVIELVQVKNRNELVLGSDVDLYQSKLLNIDNPLGDPRQISELQVSVEPWLVPSISIDNRQKMNDNILTLNENVSAIAETEQLSLPTLNITESTREELLMLAQGAVGNETDQLVQLTSLREFVSQFMADSARVSITTIESLLENPEGDCTEHTQLFNALAHVLGFNARSVNGLVYLGDEQGGFAGHQWSEVLVNDYWVGFDPTWNINSLTATHIRLKQDKAASVYRKIKTSNDATLRLLNKQ